MGVVRWPDSRKFPKRFRENQAGLAVADRPPFFPEWFEVILRGGIGFIECGGLEKARDPEKPGLSLRTRCRPKAGALGSKQKGNAVVFIAEAG